MINHEIHGDHCNSKWLEIKPINPEDPTYETLIDDLGEGEASSIVLTMQTSDSCLVTDDGFALKTALELLDNNKAIDLREFLSHCADLSIIPKNQIELIIEKAKRENP